MTGFELLRFESHSLRGNPLNDPTQRDILLFRPDKIREGSPLLIGLTGFGGGARSFLNYSPLSQNFTDILDALKKSGKLHDAIIVIPDCFTSLGGNQYLNSDAVGAYEDFIVKEVVPRFKSEFGTGNTGLFGKSSGGFGAYTLSVRNPEVFQGFADHSGDAGFEYCYFPDFPDSIREFRRAGGVGKWFEEFSRSVNKSRKKYVAPLNVLAMAAFYSANRQSADMMIDLPFSLETGEMLDDVIERWKKFDPARNITENIGKIRNMKAVYLDVGSEDEFRINFGMNKMHRILSESGVSHFYEEFEDGHFNISYRYEQSLAYLAERLS
ncbi:MAG: alpha/beta hydrolase-fold protein [Thermoplasmataceae archaeon]